MSGSGRVSSPARAPLERSTSKRQSSKPPYYLHQAFGAPSRLGGFVIDDDTILYAVGRHIVMRNLETNAMNFVQDAPAGVNELTAMTVSADRRHVCVCERVTSAKATAQPRVRVVHVGGKRTVATLTAAVEGQYEACAFSEDDKYVLAYSGAPDYVVVMWRWADERPVGMMRSKGPIGRVRFSPGSSTLLSINAPMRICRLSDKGHFKEIEVGALKRYGQNAVDHDWLSATKLAVATAFEKGSFSVLIFSDGSLAQTIKDLAFVPRCVASFVTHGEAGTLDERHGFMVGGADGQVLIFRAPKEGMGGGGGGGGVGSGVGDLDRLRGGGGDYREVATAQGAAGQGDVRGLELSPDGSVAIAWCSELCALPLREMLLEAEAAPALQAAMAAGNSAADDERGTRTFSFGVAVSGAHSGAVTAMACSVSKPLLVSCSSVDNTVRVWDYRAWQCQLVSHQPEGPQGVALHPDGMQLLLSFKERLRAFHIGIADLLPWREHSFPCKEVAYSAHGHYFAAASEKAVLLFDSYGHQQLARLEGLGAPPACLRWGVDDAFIAAADSTGVVCTWSRRTARKVHEHRAKCAISSALVAADPQGQSPAGRGGGGGGGADGVGGRRDSSAGLVGFGSGSGFGGGGRREAEASEGMSPLLLASGADGALRQMGRGDEVETVSGDHGATCVGLLPRLEMAAVGTANGSVTTLDMPLSSNAHAALASAIALHCGGVTCVLPTQGDSLLFTAGADGAIFALKLGGGFSVEMVEPTYSEVQCVPRAALAASEAALSEAQARYKQLEASSQAALMRLETRLRQSAEAQQAEHALQLQDVEKRLAANHSHREQELAAAEQRMEELAGKLEEKRRKDVVHLEACLKKEIDRHDEAASQLAATRNDAQMRLALAGLQVQQAEDAKATLRREKEEMAEAMRVQHEREVGALMARHAEVEIQEERDHGEMIERERNAREASVAQQTETVNQLQVQAFLARRKYEQRAQEKAAAEKELEETREQVKEAHNDKRELQAQIDKLRREAHERERVLAEREQRFVTLRDENLRLEACRNVLSFRLQELENEREPLQIEVVELKQEVTEAEEAVLAEGKKKAEAEHEARALHARHAQVNDRLLRAEKRAHDAETFLLTTCSELAQLCTDEGRSWERMVSYVQARTLQAESTGHMQAGAVAQARKALETDKEVTEELIRQRDRMQSTVVKLKKEIEHEAAKARAEHLQQRSEVGMLLADLSDLRKVNKQMTQQLQAAKRQMQQQKRRDEEGAREGKLAARRTSLAATAKSQREEAELHALENSVLREQLLFFSATMPPGKRQSRSAGNLSMSMPLPPV